MLVVYIYCIFLDYRETSTTKEPTDVLNLIVQRKGVNKQLTTMHCLESQRRAGIDLELGRTRNSNPPNFFNFSNHEPSSKKIPNHIF